jgi:hypothetical protein
VLKNSLPQVQAGYTIRTQEVLRAQQAAGINAQAVTRLGFPGAQGHLAARTEVVSGVRYHRLLAADGSDVAQFGRRLAHLARQEQTDVLHAATDHAGYAEQIAEAGDAEPRLRRVRAGEPLPISVDRPATKYETKARDAGSAVTELIWVRI